MDDDLSIAPVEMTTSVGTNDIECELRDALWHGDQGGHGFDAVPEVLQAEVLVGGVLVVVVIGDGDADGTGVGGSLHGFERDGAAGGGQQDDFAAGALDGRMTSAAMGRSMGVREAFSPSSARTQATLGWARRSSRVAGACR